MLAEENNLGDCLREAMALPDPATTAHLMAALGGFWTIKGDNARVIAVAAAVEDAFVDGCPRRRTSTPLSPLPR